MTTAARFAARILVVDDIPANRDLVATVVRHMGHVVSRPGQGTSVRRSCPMEIGERLP